ncbi:acetate/propionate family kinase [Streptomonospora nanhaiensis]|uniref:Acetate kinase n=1 Tax=Streptomonospora nanhaiensis TaxID=1323731 RepID=A0A853BV79_9ACTN|nr:acetate kinase [Streptomonospora nanhaiensis]MBX9390823.1 acetate kinase [Streptomonospora nanhaiensis]NYI98132.1 acetate kinase [Streptomonospora nanhaiensis]
MSHVLVVNSGSSSIKYRLLDMAAQRPIAWGIADRIGEDGGELTHRRPGTDPHVRPGPFADHEAGLSAVLDAFGEAGPDLSGIELAAVGHRVVHGGDRFVRPAVVDDAVMRAVEELAPLAPLHNPANLEGIRVARKSFPDVPHVAVFDTAFHSTLPPAAHTYAVPGTWRTEYGVRRYGFHGTSCAYVTRRAAAWLGRDPEQVNLIVLHLGNGASATAVAGGRSVDTSMGMTPLEGLVMGTRSGDIDPSLPGYLAREAGLTAGEVDTALNRESGLLALAGANDMREVRRRAAAGESGAALALEVYAHRVRKYVGAYYAVLGRVDAVVFTAGVGEHDARLREDALRGLDALGLAVDPERNAADSGEEREVSPPGARVPVLVVPTDEEWEIAVEAVALVEGRR